jgi:hypothetical protein
MSPRRDNKQWNDACREAGLSRDEKDRATEDFHAEKRASGERGHWPYGKLTNWLQQWAEDKWQS